MMISFIVLSGAWLFTTWRSSDAVLPPGLTINGVPMGGTTREQALTAIEHAYTVPISITYAGRPIPLLLPEMIELRVDMDATAENLDEAIATEASPEAFIRYVVDQTVRQDPEVIEVRAVVLYSRERVNTFLERVAQKYDHRPVEPVPLPEAGTFRPARDGTEIDIEASLPKLIDAILAADPAEREVALVVDVEPAPQASVGILTQALDAALADFGGVAGIFAKDLTTGQELCVGCDAAFTGLNTLKMGIALELYRRYDDSLRSEHRSLINAMLTQSDHAAADRLLADIGEGNAYDGAQQVTDFLRSLGLENSYLAAPYEPQEDAPVPDIKTPANSRADATMAPDPYIQTTPMEVGLLLEGVYQCTQNGGSLRALYPQAITPIECEEMLHWIDQREMDPLLGEGMPAGIRVVHTHGWRENTYADVALVYGPKVDFLLVAFLYQPAWQAWEESVPTFSQIGALTYRFFNGDAEVLVNAVQ